MKLLKNTDNTDWKTKINTSLTLFFQNIGGKKDFSSKKLNNLDR